MLSPCIVTEHYSSPVKRSSIFLWNSSGFCNVYQRQWEQTRIGKSQAISVVDSTRQYSITLAPQHRHTTLLAVTPRVRTQQRVVSRNIDYRIDSKLHAEETVVATWLLVTYKRIGCTPDVQFLCKLASAQVLVLRGVSCVTSYASFRRLDSRKEDSDARRASFRIYNI